MLKKMEERGNKNVERGRERGKREEKGKIMPIGKN
jgi:hypothetical protein